MKKYDYTYKGAEGYCYPRTNVLKNRLNIKDNEALAIAEREITSIKLSMFYNMPLLNDLIWMVYVKYTKQFLKIYEYLCLTV